MADDATFGPQRQSFSADREERWAPLGGVRECSTDECGCAAEYRSCVSSCVDFAFSDPGFNCTGTCRDNWCVTCSSTQKRCGLHSYSFSGGDPLKELQSACESAVARDRRCATATILDNCETVARVESADMIGTYECLAALDCTADPRPCMPPPDDHVLESKVCEKVTDYCEASQCKAEWRKALNGVAPWLRRDALDAVEACLNETHCRDIQDCLSAWHRAVFKGSTVETMRRFQYR